MRFINNITLILLFSLNSIAAGISITPVLGLSNSVTKTSAYSLSAADSIVYADATSSAFTLTFPAASANPGKVFTIKKTDLSFNAVTLSGSGMITNYLMTVGETACFQSDGSNWIQIYRKTDTGYATYSMGWKAVTTNPTIGNGTIAAVWRRISDSIEIVAKIVPGSTTTFGSGTYLFEIPNVSGWTINTSVISLSNPGSVVGDFHFNNGSVANAVGIVFINSSTQLAAFTHGNANNVNPTSPATFANGNVMTFRATVPITNFSP